MLESNSLILAVPEHDAEDDAAPKGNNSPPSFLRDQLSPPKGSVEGISPYLSMDCKNTDMRSHTVLDSNSHNSKLIPTTFSVLYFNAEVFGLSWMNSGHWPKLKPHIASV